VKVGPLSVQPELGKCSSAFIRANGSLSFIWQSKGNLSYPTIPQLEYFISDIERGARHRPQSTSEHLSSMKSHKLDLSGPFVTFQPISTPCGLFLLTPHCVPLLSCPSFQPVDQRHISIGLCTPPRTRPPGTSAKKARVCCPHAQFPCAHGPPSSVLQGKGLVGVNSYPIIPPFNRRKNLSYC